MFTDVDFSTERSPALALALFVIFILVGSLFFVKHSHWNLFLPILIVSGLVSYFLSVSIHKIAILIRGGAEKVTSTRGASSEPRPLLGLAYFMPTILPNRVEHPLSMRSLNK
jgi:hypothetical protein